MNKTNLADIFTEAARHVCSTDSFDLVPVPKKMLLYPLDLDQWTLTHCEFMGCCGVSRASPFTLLKDHVEFWVHAGAFDKKIKSEKFIRIFRPHQTITSLESLY